MIRVSGSGISRQIKLKEIVYSQKLEPGSR